MLLSCGGRKQTYWGLKKAILSLPLSQKGRNLNWINRQIIIKIESINEALITSMEVVLLSWRYQKFFINS